MNDVRDTLKDAEYFDTYIAMRTNSLAEEFEGLNNPSFSNKKIIYYGIYMDIWRLMHAKYSAGHPLDDFSSMLSEALPYVRDSIRDYTGPGIPQKWLALGTLLGFSDADRVVMQDILDRVQKKDPYVALLAEANGLHDTVVKPDKRKGSWWGYYLKLKDIESKEERERILGDYLRRYWYNSTSGEPWYGSHKYTAETSKNPYIYFGYWAFDIAACAKAMGLDDASFRDHKYYPKDMADWLKGGQNEC